jgi:hypothetical protein
LSQLRPHGFKNCEGSPTHLHQIRQRTVTLSLRRPRQGNPEMIAILLQLVLTYAFKIDNRNSRIYSPVRRIEKLLIITVPISRRIIEGQRLVIPTIDRGS